MTKRHEAITGTVDGVLYGVHEQGSFIKVRVVIGAELHSMLLSREAAEIVGLAMLESARADTPNGEATVDAKNDLVHKMRDREIESDLRVLALMPDAEDWTRVPSAQLNEQVAKAQSFVRLEDETIIRQAVASDDPDAFVRSLVHRAKGAVFPGTDK